MAEDMIDLERVALAICEAGEQEPGFMGNDVDAAMEAAKAPQACEHSCVACRNVARAAIAAMAQGERSSQEQVREKD